MINAMAQKFDIVIGEHTTMLCRQGGRVFAPINEEIVRILVDESMDNRFRHGSNFLDLAKCEIGSLGQCYGKELKL